MRCLRASDWYEHHGDEPPTKSVPSVAGTPRNDTPSMAFSGYTPHRGDTFGPEWEQILVHSHSCPDCALLVKQRAQMFEAMSQMPVPQPPVDLHVRILQAVEVDKDMGEGGSSPINEWIDRLLPTFQVAMTAACLVLAIGLLRPLPPTKGMDDLERLRIRANAPEAVVRPPQPVANSPQLVKLSPAEVTEFMQKLNAYRRQHPEMDIHQTPQLSSELVGYSNR